MKLSACTFSSQKFEGRAPEGYTLLRAFVGGSLYEDTFNLDDKSMEALVQNELQKMLGIKRRPVFVSIRRYPHAMPQYQVGHADKISSIQKRLKNLPGLYLTGNAYEGIGIPDCVYQAQKQAEALASYLSTLPSR